MRLFFFSWSRIIYFFQTSSVKINGTNLTFVYCHSSYLIKFSIAVNFNQFSTNRFTETLKYKRDLKQFQSDGFREHGPWTAFVYVLSKKKKVPIKNPKSSEKNSQYNAICWLYLICTLFWFSDLKWSLLISVLKFMSANDF